MTNNARLAEVERAHRRLIMKVMNCELTADSVEKVGFAKAVYF